jgi:hypothetical protein
VRCTLWVGGGQLDQGQRDEFAAQLGGRDAAPGQVAHRAVEQLADLVQHLGRDDLHGVAHGAAAVGLGRQAGLAPDILGRQALGGVEAVGRLGAAIVGVALGQPQPAHLVGHGLRGRLAAAQLVDQQGIAAHLAVVAHAVLGMLGGEGAPVAALAQQQQPVVAQPVFLVAAGVAGAEGLHVRARQILQPAAGFPVRRPGFQHMAADLRQQAGQPRLVATPGGLLHVQDELVGAGLGRAGQGRAQAGHEDDRCQNGPYLHGGGLWRNRPRTRRASARPCVPHCWTRG